MQAEEITLSSITYRKNLQQLKPHPAVMGTLLKLGEIQPLIFSLCSKLISNFYYSVLGFFFLTAYTQIPQERRGSGHKSFPWYKFTNNKHVPRAQDVSGLSASYQN